MNRRAFIKTGLIYVPTWFVCRGGAVSLSKMDPETAIWIANLKSVGRTHTGVSVVANDTFVKLLKANNLRSSVVWASLFTGVGVDSVKSGIIRDANPSVLDSPQALDEADFAEGTGLTGNGTNEFILSGCRQADLYALDGTNHSFCYGAYVCSSTNQSGFAMGVFNGSDYIYLYVSNGSGTSFFSTGVSANQISVADSAGTGLYVGSYNSTTDSKLYKRGAQIGTSATPGATYQGSGLFVGIMDVNNQNSLTPVAPSTKTWGGYFCGKGMTATQVAVMNDIWKRVMGILGRTVV